MYQTIFKDEVTKFWKNFNIFIIIFGSIAGTISFVLSFIEIVKSFKEDAQAEEELIV